MPARECRASMRVIFSFLFVREEVSFETLMATDRWRMASRQIGMGFSSSLTDISCLGASILVVEWSENSTQSMCTMSVLRRRSQMQNTHPPRNQDSCTGSYHKCLYTLYSSLSREFMKVHADALKTGQKGGICVYFTQT